MRRKIIAANWKMNLSPEESSLLASELSKQIKNLPSNVEVVLAPPSVYISEVKRLTASNPKISIAAQNCHSEKSGAYTGEISAEMIRGMGAKYVIIGHSERRKYFNEDAVFLSKKSEAALNASLTPIFCVGETLEQRESGKQMSVVQDQIEESLFHLSGSDFTEIVLAYEPVWAIGTGRTASSGQAQEMHQGLRSLIEKKYGAKVASGKSILYGGSCNAANARELFSMPDVDGGLIGGASLIAKEFLEIIQSA